MKKINQNLILIDWVDSGSDDKIWSSKDDYSNEPAECRTVGFLVEKNKLAYVVAQSDGDTQWGNIFVIPIKSIKKIRKFNA